MRNKIIIVCIGLLSGTISVVAQTHKNDTTLNRTVVVEREYNPIIENGTKVNVLPEVIEPNITPKKVEYDLVAVQPTSYSVALVAPIVAKEIEERVKLGYMRLGIGNYGNLDARAHYTFLMTPKDKLVFDFTSYGMSGKLDQTSLATNKDKWNSFYYRTFGSLGYEHKFDSVILNLGGGIRVNNFNYGDYQEFDIPLLDKVLLKNKQRFNKTDFSARLRSLDDDLFIKYDISTQFMLYQRQFDIIKSKLKESSLNTTAKLYTDINLNRKIGLDVNMYNRVISGSEIKNSTTLDMNPYYGITIDNWTFRLGANLDLGFGHGESFLVSPDVKAELVIADQYKFYAQATGGRIKSDFSKMEEVSPYTLIASTNRDSYEQINAKIGFQGNLFQGAWFSIYGGFQKLKDDLFQRYEIPAYPITYFDNYDTKNGYIGAKVSYKYRQLFSFSIMSEYRNWSSDGEEYGALLFKPKFNLVGDLYVKPMEKLVIGINYKYVERKENKDIKTVFSVGKINDLSVYASYEFVKNLSAYAKLDNIFNKKYQYFYGYPVEGTNFIAGLSFKF